MNQSIRLSIPGIKCNVCVATIEKALGNQSGVIKAEVDLQTRAAIVESNVPLKVLVDAIKASGFDATELATETRE